MRGFTGHGRGPRATLDCYEPKGQPNGSPMDHEGQPCREPGPLVWPREGSWLPATTARRERGIDPSSCGAKIYPTANFLAPAASGGTTPNKRASHEPRPTSDEPEARGSAETPGAFERRRLRAASERALTRGCPFAGPAARPDGRGAPAARGRAPHRPRPPGRAARPAALRGEGAANYSRRDGSTPHRPRPPGRAPAALRG